MVYYLKYRPQTIEELDSEDVRQTLTSVLSASSVSHAFLFTGPKGLGKTSTARIVAKYVNCEKGKGESVKGKDGDTKKEKNLNPLPSPLDPGTIPCNKCASCISITDGTNLDVLEIDAASNRGIDEMRDLREKIRLLPVSANKKVYIIDEVHMLTTEAFNALLKTLEEPPAHAMFVLCTTESHKVPATILSRCFHIQFKKATDAELVHSLERIVQAEKIEADSDALFAIASRADGSFRDGTKILEEIVLSSKEKKITKQLVDTLYHATTIDADVIQLLLSWKEADPKKGLQIVQKLLEQGTDMKYFLEQVLLSLHLLLLIKTGISQEKAQIELDIETIKKLVLILSKAYSEMKSAILPQLPLEMMIVEWNGDKGKGESLKGKVKEEKIEQIVIVNEVKQSQSVTETASSSSTPRSDKIDDKTFFYQLLDKVKEKHHMLAGILRSCKISQTEAGLQIEAPSSFHQQKLTDKKALDFLEEVCEDITGNKMKISVVLKS